MTYESMIGLDIGDKWENSRPQTFLAYRRLRTLDQEATDTAGSTSRAHHFRRARGARPSYGATPESVLESRVHGSSKQASSLASKRARQ